MGRQGIFWGYYTAYDANGDSHWYLFQFSRGTRYIVVDLLEFQGPPLGTAWDPERVDYQSVGLAAIDYYGPQFMTFRHHLEGGLVFLRLIPFQ